MSVIKRRIPWAKKPSYPLNINWSNAISKNLVQLTGNMFSAFRNDSVNKYHGTLAGNTKKVAGKEGDAWNFDGAGDYIDLGAMGSFGSRLDAHETTMHFIFKTSTITTMALCGAGNSGGNDTVLQATINRNGATGANSEGRLIARIRDEDNTMRTVESAQNNNITDGEYQHVTFSQMHKHLI